MNRTSIIGIIALAAAAGASGVLSAQQRGRGPADHPSVTVKGHAYTPQNVLATLYHVLGIDPETTLPDHQGRPVYLLDDRERVTELV